MKVFPGKFSMRSLTGDDRFRQRNFVYHRSGATASFSPLDLSPALWLDATVGTYQSADTSTPSVDDGDPVRMWADQSGNSINVSQGTSSKRPSLIVPGQNGLPVVGFDGIDDFLRNVAFRLSQPMTLMIVFTNEVQAVGPTVWNGTAADTVELLGLNADRAMFAGNDLNPRVTEPAVGTCGLYTAIYNGASSTIRLNAGSTTTGSPGTGSFSDGITVGCKFDETNFTTGNIAELLAFSGVLSAGNQTSLRNYLNTKWGIF